MINKIYLKAIGRLVALTIANVVREIIVSRVVHINEKKLSCIFLQLSHSGNILFRLPSIYLEII